MKKINLLLIGMLLFTISIIAQQQPIYPTNTSLFYNDNFNQEISSNNSKAATIISIEEFNSYGSGINGAPTGWVVNSTAPDTINQWRWLEDKGSPIPAFGMPWSGAISDRDEILISPEYTVPTTNPVLLFDISISYYWFVDQQSDDLYVYVSDDDFVTQTLVWKEDDQLLVEESGIEWPYNSFQWYTAEIDLSTFAGQNIKIKFHSRSVGAADGTKGVSCYLDNIGIGIKNDNDLKVYRANSCYSYTNNIYSYIPIDQVDGNNMFAQAVVKNIGINTQTDINLDYSIAKNNSVVYSQNVSTFKSGLTNLYQYAVDTFEFTHTLTPEVNSSYVMSYTVNQAQSEQDISDNITSYNFDITQNRYARYRSYNEKMSVGLYYGAMSGDELGNSFTFINDATIKSISCYIAPGTDVGTTIRANVYSFDGSSYSLLESSANYNIESSDIGNFVELSLQNGCVVTAGEYVASIQFFWGTGQYVYIGSEKNPINPYSSKAYLQNDVTWYYTIGDMPAINVYLETAFDIISNSGNEACIGEDVQLQVSPSTGQPCQWYLDNVELTGETGETLDLNNIQANQGGVYSCAQSGEAMTFTLNIVEAQITAQPANAEVCEASSHTFNISAIAANITYQWQYNGVDISGATSYSYAVNNVSASDIGNYTCTISDNCGNVIVSDVATLGIAENITASIDQSNFTICNSEDTTLSLSTTGNIISYQWQFNGININGATSDTYTITSADVNNSGNYTCIVEGECNNTTTNNVELTVNTTTATINEGNLDVCIDTYVSLTLTTTGTNLTYQWQYNGANIPGANNDNLQIGNVSYAASGNYTCVVTGDCGYITTDEITLSILELTTANINENDFNICEGENSSISVTASGENLTYQWQLNGVDIAGATSDSYAITNFALADVGNYSCIVTGECGTVLTDVVAIDLNQNYFVTQNAMVCLYDSYTFPDGTVEENITTQVVHSSNLQTVNACDSIIETTVNVDVIDVSVTVNIEIITANATGVAYNWYNCDDNLPITGEISQSFTPTVSGNYAVIINDGFCQDTSECNYIETSGIDDILNNNFNIYPIPTDNYIIVEQLSNKEIKSISIYDITGKNVLNMNASEIEKINKIDISEFEKGIYMIKIDIDNNIIVRQIIKE